MKRQDTCVSIIFRTEIQMKISGFTFTKDAIKYAFPPEESIRSILPIVNEFIVNISESEDTTLEVVKSINNPKIKIIRSSRDSNLKTKGKILTQQTNIALEQCKGGIGVFIYRLTR